MNRNTRIFLYGVVLLGVGILLLRVDTEPGEFPLLGFIGLLFGLVGLALSASAAFRHDP